ncbi:Chemotaxis protein CheY [Fundidesulfovibrio magnetotacticus]|uniref:Chemotaxis protein CheY n=1 Tax=Fundidesulfovibrio magnetotacticus TaxID=2730080 RepID=A0A6V8M4L8_9BACT|nr:response regulator [Fundidesulfovibrio magnetotacticus]GFK95385.1 Chemotaxis protein CheY [Fundidesulfovibrio magnetotacticus]
MKTDHRIALIEPSERIREALARRLRESGHTRVAEAGSPEAYASQAGGGHGGEPVDLAVVDVDHGGIPDLSVLEALRRQEAFREARFLALAGRQGLAAVDTALHGVSAVLAKPFCAQLFIDTVDELLGVVRGAPHTATIACGPVIDHELFTEAHPAHEPGRASVTVLVVDDSVSMRHVVKQHLAHMGFTQVECAANVTEALAMLQSRPVGLIISDLRMPGRSGLDFLDTVRADPKLAHTPFVLVSSESTLENVFQAGRHSASAFLPKPFTPAALERVLASALKKS